MKKSTTVLKKKIRYEFDHESINEALENKAHSKGQPNVDVEVAYAIDSIFIKFSIWVSGRIMEATHRLSAEDLFAIFDMKDELKKYCRTRLDIKPIVGNNYDGTATTRSFLGAAVEIVEEINK